MNLQLKLQTKPIDANCLGEDFGLWTGRLDPSISCYHVTVAFYRQQAVHSGTATRHSMLNSHKCGIFPAASPPPPPSLHSHTLPSCGLLLMMQWFNTKIKHFICQIKYSVGKSGNPTINGLTTTILYVNIIFAYNRCV